MQNESYPLPVKMTPAEFRSRAEARARAINVIASQALHDYVLSHLEEVGSHWAKATRVEIGPF